MTSKLEALIEYIEDQAEGVKHEFACSFSERAEMEAELQKHLAVLREIVTAADGLVLIVSAVAAMYSAPSTAAALDRWFASVGEA